MLEISSLINPSVTALSSQSEKILQICTHLLGIKTSLDAQPTSKQISIILLHQDYSKICNCNTLSCGFQHSPK